LIGKKQIRLINGRFKLINGKFFDQNLIKLTDIKHVTHKLHGLKTDE